jgi:hypothetical protein
MKKILIGNQEYAVKRLLRIVVAPFGAALVKHNEKLLYRNGFAIVGCADRVYEFCTGGRKDGSRLSLFYYDSDDGRAEMLFPEEDNLKEWQKLFIYLFDEHGAFLLYTCKKLGRYVVPRCRMVNESGITELREEMLNTLGMIDDRLPVRILDMERFQSDDDGEGFLLGETYER